MEDQGAYFGPVAQSSYKEGPVAGCSETEGEPGETDMSLCFAERL